MDIEKLVELVEAYDQLDSDKDDARFAEYSATESGAMENPDVQGWPFTRIDWEWAAKDLMMDYSEQGGHYFRSM